MDWLFMAVFTKQVTVSTATRYGIKPRIQGCPMGERTHRGSNHPIKKKKMAVFTA